MYGMFDPLYLWITIISLVLSIGAQLYLKTTFSKWSKTANTKKLTGREVGEKIIQSAQLTGVSLESTAGTLSDHYDPRKNTVRMSKDIENESSVASMAIVAHELGHAQQYAQASGLIKARSFLLPAVSVSPHISYGLIMMGLIFNLTGLFMLGVYAFGLVVLFSLLTLPIEFDASRRGLVLLRQSGIIVSDEDSVGSRSVLTAAALTYIAAAVTAVLQLLYYLSLARRQS